MRRKKASLQRVFVYLSAAVVAIGLWPTEPLAQAIIEEVEAYEELPPVLTHTPYDTVQTLVDLHDALIEALTVYNSRKTARNFDRIKLIADALASLLDLSEETAANRRDSSVRTILALTDIVQEVDRETLDAMRNSDSMAWQEEGFFAVPGTPLILQRMEQGTRVGEFLFSANSSKIAPRYLREIATRSPERLQELWSVRVLQVSGPLIPLSLTNALPDILKQLYWGTPIWKVLFTGLFLGVGIVAFFVLNRLLKSRAATGHLNAETRRLLRWGALLTIVLLLNTFLNRQLFLTGSFARVETFVATIAIFVTMALTFWSFMATVSDYMTKRSARGGRPYDESMMRLLYHIIALVGATWIIAYGAQALGFPLLSILAGLGVGGLAVALAIRPTLENLISGFVLYLEKSVSIGDYCSFEGLSGTVERIGVRSVSVRALDRTIISIPNSKFVDMKLVNFAVCDEMLVNFTIGLRYETNTDQLRFVLAEIRRMMHGHPRINSDTVRVRFVGYGESSLDVDVRVYAQAREWNDFYAVREDVLFRIKEIVENSGTGFAFPSQTIYTTKDDGLDEQKSDASVEQVRHWRLSGKLPFPNFATQDREAVENKLYYPPRGSPEFFAPDEDTTKVEEPLSAGEEASPESSSDNDRAKDQAPSVDTKGST